MTRRVVVTGYGAVSALGDSVPEIWRSIENYKIGYSQVEFADETIKCKYFGFMAPNRERYAGLRRRGKERIKGPWKCSCTSSRPTVCGSSLLAYSWTRAACRYRRIHR